MGWSETKALWRVPLWKINVYMHCHLFSQGAKLLTQRTTAALNAKMEDTLKALCKASLS